MKRPLIIIFVFVILTGTSFTMLQSSKKPKGETDFCCKRKNFKEKQDTKKAIAPGLYLPVVNFF